MLICHLLSIMKSMQPLQQINQNQYKNSIKTDLKDKAVIFSNRFHNFKHHLKPKQVSLSVFNLTKVKLLILLRLPSQDKIEPKQIKHVYSLSKSSELL